jgi:hypothetical protein
MIIGSTETWDNTLSTSDGCDRGQSPERGEDKTGLGPAPWGEVTLATNRGLRGISGAEPVAG